jgi:hypothetical protein
MSNEKVFANGFSFKRRESAPDFVVGNLSVKVDDAIKFLQEKQKDGWANLDIMKSQKGTYYVELNTWTPDNKSVSNEVEKSDDLPF